MRDGALTVAALSVPVGGTGCVTNLASWFGSVMTNITVCGTAGSQPIGHWNEQGGRNGDFW